jgi:hemoglobin
MPPTPLCTQDDNVRLVHHFYRRVRQDELLGPIFDVHIQHWDEHLERMVRFWSSLLLRSGTYSGTPMPRHTALPDIEGHMCTRWLELFRLTTEEFDNPPFVAQANEFAHRVARSLWLGYQITNHPDQTPVEFDHVQTDAH